MGGNGDLHVLYSDSIYIYIRIGTCSDSGKVYISFLVLQVSMEVMFEYLRI